MHNIMYWVYPEKTSESTITKNVLEYVATHGDKYGTDNIQFLSKKVYDNRAAAEEFISSVDKGWYGGYAVKFYDFTKVKSTKAINDLRQKICDTLAKKKEYEDAHSVKAQKATLIGCSRCGSKLSREYLKSEWCPVCRTDLRAPTTLDRLKSFDARVKEYNKKINDENLKAKKKANVMWLVKFEYHS